MSQIEQNFREFISKKPEIEKCYSEGLINRRALARYIVEKKISSKPQLNAVIAMLRRFDFKTEKKDEFQAFKNIKTSIKDNLVILNFEKNESLAQKLSVITGETNYVVSETFKVIVGTTSVTLIIDESKEKNFKKIFEKTNLTNRSDNISEISILFPKEVISAKGIIAVITRELFLNDIVVSELLTASQELLIYVKEEFVLKSYEIIKRLK